MQSLRRLATLVLALANAVAIAQTNQVPGNPVVVNGNLGVGTNNPGAPLDVAGTSLVDILKVDSDRRDPSRFLSLSSYGQDGVIRINPGSNSTIYVNREVGTVSSSVGPTTRDFHIWDGNVTDLLTVIGSTGDVGIGTSTPGNMLDGNGNAVAGPLLMDILPGSKVGGVVAGGSRTLDVAPSQRQGYFLRRNDQWNAYNDGLWTGGNSSGSEYWENVILGAQGGGANLIFMTGGSQTERMRIDPNGNVGIGTRTPGVRLDVVGNLRINGSGAGIIFPDGTTQTTAQVQGPSGPQGPQGPLGPAISLPFSASSSTTAGAAFEIQTTSDAAAVVGQGVGNGAVGVMGSSTNNSGIGIEGVNTSGGLSAQFVGPVFISGSLNVNGNLSKAGGSFKIDHPLDPSNKYLYHSFVESPDMKNIYDGLIVLDNSGEAIVQLPDWLQPLNRDFRYQLTSLGSPQPNLYVAEEVANGQFKIAGGMPGGKVSWQVTGIRQDAWANAHRIPVEEDKAPQERGYYLHPELFGAPEEKGIEWVRHPEIMQQIKEGLLKGSNTALHR